MPQPESISASTDTKSVIPVQTKQAPPSQAAGVRVNTAANSEPDSKFYVFNRAGTKRPAPPQKQDVHRHDINRRETKGSDIKKQAQARQAQVRKPAQAIRTHNTDKVSKIEKTGKNTGRVPQKIHPIKKLNRKFRKVGLGYADASFNARFFYYIWKIEKAGTRSQVGKYNKYVKFMTMLAKIYGIAACVFMPVVILFNLLKPEPLERKGWQLKRAARVFAPLGAVALTGLTIINISGYRPTLELWVDGERLGVVESRDMVTSASRQSEINISEILGEPYYFTGIIDYRVVLMRDPSFITEREIYNIMRRHAQDYIMPAYGLYIDGELIGVTTDGSYIDNTLSHILEEIAVRNPNEVDAVEFANDIQIVSGDYARRDVLTGEAFKNILTYSAVAAIEDAEDTAPPALEDAVMFAVFNPDDAEQESAAMTGIEAGDEAGTDIAAAAAVVNLSREAVNTLPRGGINTLIGANDNNIFTHLSQSSASTARIGLRAIKTRTESYLVDVPFETQRIESDQQLVGTETVRTAGSNGMSRKTVEISFTGDIEISRRTVNEEVITPAVAQVIVVGTRARPSTNPTGTFIRPVNGRISVGFSSGHRAIDIPAPSGTPVLAADGGTVIAASYRGSYGNHIMIRHANGYVTLYAHLSSMSVRPGDQVFQRQEIGRVGSTGRSTGPHLHFEIIRNGVQVNPLNYMR